MTEDIQILIEKFLADGIKNGSLCEEDISRFSDNLIPTLEKVGDLLFDDTKENLSKHIKSIRADYVGFAKRNYHYWKDGLDLLDFYLALVAEAGSSHNQKYRNELNNDNYYLIEAITRIHARQLQVAQEVLTLLKKGFADGAEARWRTAHELAVIGYFISEYGNECAEGYLKHEIIESYKLIENYKSLCEEVNADFVTVEEYEKLKKQSDLLCAEYGKSFYSDYGWASNYLNKERPTFTDLEKKVGLSNFRNAYKFSCSNIHGGSRGVIYRLGLLNSDDILLCGPSNFGISSPAINIAISILQMTTLLLKYNKNVDSYVFSRVLIRYNELITETFSRLNEKYISYH